MAAVTAFEAKTRFGELLDRVSRGEEIVITRHKKPVARLVPEGRPSLSRIQWAVSELEAVRSEISAQKGFRELTDKEIRDAVQHGRR